MQNKLDHTSNNKFRILILDKENSSARMKRRIRKVLQGYNLSNNFNIYIWFDPNIQLDQPHTPDYYELLKFIEEHSINVLIIDSLVRFFSGQENSVDDVRQIHATLKKIKDKYGLTILILHHTRKSTGAKTAQDLRGSNDTVAAVDEVFIVDKIKKNLYKISQHKNRDAENVPAITFRVVDTAGDKEAIYLENVSLENIKTDSTIDSAKNSINTWIANLKTADFRTKDVLKSLIEEHSKSAINNALDEFCEEGHLKKLRQGRWRVLKGGETNLTI